MNRISAQERDCSAGLRRRDEVADRCLIDRNERHHSVVHPASGWSQIVDPNK
jgi:hypothetical protein